MASVGDLVAEYRSYLERFETLAGPGDFGSFIKHNGRLVKKLRYDEFEPKYTEYFEVARAYEDSVARGDTINDVVVKILRDRCDELILTNPTK
jgi:hypothetical protein